MNLHFIPARASVLGDDITETRTVLIGRCGPVRIDPLTDSLARDFQSCSA